MKDIYLCGGCFWSIDAVYSKIKGVIERQCGYIYLNDPKDKIETVYIHYDEKIISFNTLIEVFFSVHNPTSVKWGFCKDFPTCRSALLVNKVEEKEIIEQYINKISSNYEEDIETKIFLPNEFYFKLASDYDQNFYAKKPTDGFCTSIILPKLENFSSKFKHLLV